VAACLTNHFVIDTSAPNHYRLGDIEAPTLVVHGELDPVFHIEHAYAMQRAIPGAELLVLERTGHDVPPQVWDVFVSALLRHTGG
jgi:pimeloyl-ACP methyl ester carboxylesterase